MLNEKSPCTPAANTRTNGINMSPAIWFAPRTSVTREETITATSMLKIPPRGANKQQHYARVPVGEIVVA